MLAVVNAGLAAAAGIQSMVKPGSTGECHATPCEGQCQWMASHENF